MGQGREYEDLAERIALRKLLPPRGGASIEFGAGFGRLADLYDGYEQVILLDYARSGLQEAQERLGRPVAFSMSRPISIICPLPRVCDTAVTVRVLHHIADVPAALLHIAAMLRTGRRLCAGVRQQAQSQGHYPLSGSAVSAGRRSPEPYEFAV